MGTLWQDIRFGLRMLRKSPGFTTVAVLTLALGIGANTAIFTLVNALLLRPLPGVEDPQQLVLVTDNGWPNLNYPLYEHLRDNCDSLSGLFASAGIAKRMVKVTRSGDATAEPVWSQPVSGEFFSILGVQALLGRTLTPNDDRPGQPQPVVVSYDFWLRRLGGDPTVIGQTIALEDVPSTIIGVAPSGFVGFVVERRPDVWWPIQMVPQVQRWEDALTGTGHQWLQIAGRLKPGVTKTQAQDELDVVFKRMRLAQAENWRGSETRRQDFLSHRIELHSTGTGFSWLRRDFLRLLFLLTGIGGSVLLIVCTNLAGLLLVRGAAWQREFGVRAALGAGRFVLVRQLVAESLLLAAGGGTLGLLVAQGGVRLLANYIPDYGQSVQLALTPDLRILAFTFLTSVGTGLFFGLLPALRTTHCDVVTTLKNEAGGVVGRAPGQLWNRLLVVSQIGLTCLLLIGAGLFMRTLQTLKSLDAGFHRENLMLFELDLARDYDDSRRAQLYAELLRQLEGLPGVQSASSASVLSMGAKASYFTPNLMIDAVGAKTTDGLHCRGVAVASNYLKTMGIRLVAGRDFGPEDEPAAGADEGKQTLRKVILSESVAKGLFGQDNPVGRQLWESGRSEPTLEVIGVVRDARHRRLRDEPSPTLFYYMSMERSGGAFYVRTKGPALSVAAGIRRIVREIAPDAEVAGLRTMENVVDDQLRQEWMLSQLAGSFSLSALALSCLGLYGTLSYAVARRTREIGIRMALGARRHNVLATVIRQGMTLTLLGCALGVVLAVALTRVVSSLLYGVTPTDPLTLALTVLLLSVVALASCWLPARRAARVDPMVTLRYE